MKKFKDWFFVCCAIITSNAVCFAETIEVEKVIVLNEKNVYQDKYKERKNCNNDKREYDSFIFNVETNLNSSLVLKSDQYDSTSSYRLNALSTNSIDLYFKVNNGLQLDSGYLGFSLSSSNFYNKPGNSYLVPLYQSVQKLTREETVAKLSFLDRYYDEDGDGYIRYYIKAEKLKNDFDSKYKSDEDIVGLGLDLEYNMIVSSNFLIGINLGVNFNIINNYVVEYGGLTKRDSSFMQEISYNIGIPLKLRLYELFDVGIIPYYMSSIDTSNKNNLAVTSSNERGVKLFVSFMY